MSRVDCIPCATLGGTRPPPGGIVEQDVFWAFFLRPYPLLAPGQGFIVLKRHCERLSELRPDEAQTLGPMMQRVELALDRVLKPAKVHFGLYGEGVHHLHLHVFPRMPSMPAGNIPVTFFTVWYELLSRIHLKQAFSDEVVAGVAQRLHTVMQSIDP